MNVVFFSAKRYDKCYFEAANAGLTHDLRFVEARLSAATVPLVAGAEAVCAFVNDVLDAPVLTALRDAGVRIIALRCAGYNNVDRVKAQALGLAVVHVPAYSPHAVAEHTIALILALNRKIHRSYTRVREGNFSLDGLLGFDLHGKTAGIVGTGRIGGLVARILLGFGMRVIAYDLEVDPECQAAGVAYVPLEDLWANADVITLHCPLTPKTRHLLDRAALERMKNQVMIINTSRGAVLDTRAVIDGLKSRKIGYLGLDVYEDESNIFFEDMSCEIIQDDVLQRLVTFPNVLVTPHQGFFTTEALTHIAQTTLESLSDFEAGAPLKHPVPDAISQ